MTPRPSRRSILKGLAAAAGGTAAGSSLWSAQALAESSKSPKFLIVLSAGGGMSIIDGPLAIRESECATPDTINCFPDQWVKSWDDSPFRAADFSMNEMGPIPASFSVTPSELLARRRKDLMVATWTRTSVNHAIGQRRSITGNEAWKGRTLQELVSWQYGADAPIPNSAVHSERGHGEMGAGIGCLERPLMLPVSFDICRDLFSAGRKKPQCKTSYRGASTSRARASGPRLARPGCRRGNFGVDYRQYRRLAQPVVCPPGKEGLVSMRW